MAAGDERRVQNYPALYKSICKRHVWSSRSINRLLFCRGTRGTGEVVCDTPLVCPVHPFVARGRTPTRLPQHRTRLCSLLELVHGRGPRLWINMGARSDYRSAPAKPSSIMPSRFFQEERCQRRLCGATVILCRTLVVRGNPTRRESKGAQGLRWEQSRDLCL